MARRLRRSFTSDLWNRVLGRRLSAFGSDVLPGDLVYDKASLVPEHRGPPKVRRIEPGWEWSWGNDSQLMCRFVDAVGDEDRQRKKSRQPGLLLKQPAVLVTSTGPSA